MSTLLTRTLDTLDDTARLAVEIATLLTPGSVLLLTGDLLLLRKKPSTKNEKKFSEAEALKIGASDVLRKPFSF
ncbi:MAG: hypothetical protein J6V91_00875, partial [Kiritimatiellae bacterium]|nr:hypothetical protein [Kiritimatiellia bacterium]